MRYWYKKMVSRYNWGKTMLTDRFVIEANNKTAVEINKETLRSEIINFVLQYLNKPETKYLEIGVRNPNHNYDKIDSKIKFSVDPGIEFEGNPVDFKMTSDAFFEGLRDGSILYKEIKFDVVFIDGLHHAVQVDRDINNALSFLEPNGFIILHDCNPPTEIHARENYYLRIAPVMDFWNGTAWKAFFKYRQNENFYSCCIDTDWGVGVITKNINLGKTTTISNPFFEYNILNENRIDSLNLMSFESFKKLLVK